MGGNGGWSSASEMCSERFELKEKLGAGGMGVVYRAYDRERRVDVALKTLRRLDGAALYRFKKEFRSLAGLTHPNLVALYELASTGAEWFFTMELLDGISLLEHVRPHRDPEVRSPTRSVTERGDHAALETCPVTTPLPVSGRPATSIDTHAERPAVWNDGSPSPHRRRVIAGKLNIARLRDAYAQLVEAIRVLHRAGKLHRDIKPSNVIVTREGRVVLCDFGLVTETLVEDRTLERNVLGTPTYMAPEQARPGDATEASDWYAVGVMLYEALTGRLPFRGAAEDVLRRKSEEPPPPPRRFDGSIPPDLDHLATALLDPDPAARPGAAEISSALGAKAPDPGSPRPATDHSSGSEDLLVGREDVLRSLEQALRDSRTHGRTVSVFIHGASGVGKSAVARHFIDRLHDDEQTIVLEGRCYERESVPYKALDTLIDALSSHLLEQPHAEIEELVPPNISALARLFPVLDRVPAVAEAAELRFELPDPHESRRRAFSALRELLSRLCEKRPVALFIDDLQWGDLDSAGFFQELLYHHRSPGLLFLATYRREEAQSSPLVQALRTSPSAGTSNNLREIALEALDERDARRLIDRIVGEAGVSDELLETIVRESSGSPLFLCELARTGLDSGATNIRLDTVLRDRISALPDEARELLKAVAVGGQPIAVGVAVHAAGIRDGAAALSALQSARLVRSRQLDVARRVESYHDRIREIVIGGMAELDLRRVHRRLARALEAQTHADPLELVDHWLGAGDHARAGHYAALAAAVAQKALAFDRAARNYRLALELQSPTGSERCALLRRLGEALANAGRLAEAAQVFKEAADLTRDDDALDLKRRAVEKFVRAGRYEDGMELAHDVLADVGLTMPGSNRRALLSVVFSRAWIKLRGLRFRQRPPEEIDPLALRRMQVCFSLSGGLAVFEPTLGTAFQMRHLRIALRTGDPHHVALALAYEIGFRSVTGVGMRDECEALLEKAEDLARRVDDPYALATARFTSGLAAYLTGQWKVALERFEIADEMTSSFATELTWERDVGILFRLATLLSLGEIGELTRQVPAYLREAADRGNQYLAIGLRSWRTNVAWLALDDPDEAERQLDLAVQALPLSSSDFHLPHYYRLLSRTQIALYRGELDVAWDLVEPGYRALNSSLINRIQFTRIESAYLRARVAVAGASGDRRDSKLAVAERMIRRMTKERAAWGISFAVLMRAMVHAVRGDRSAASTAAADAARRFEADGMMLFAQVARWRQGELQADEPGQHLIRASRAWMTEQGIAAPDRFVALYAPLPTQRQLR